MGTRRLSRQPALWAGLATLVTTGVATQAAAADWMSQDFMNPYEETVNVELGGIVNQFDTRLRLDGSSSHGTDVNLENNGLKKNLSSFEGALTWRFAPRHRVHFDYFSVSRSGSHNYTTDINIGGNDYPVGATVGISNKYQLGTLDYRYSFVQEPDYEIAAIVGFYGGKVTFDVNAVGNAGNLTAAYNKSVSTAVPLPTIGLSADWYLTKQFKVSAIVAGMKANISDVNGRIGLFSLDGDYMITRNIGVGLRYMYVDITADVNKSSFDGHFNWRSNAVSVYAKFLF
jgi:hypothetical protein